MDKPLVSLAIFTYKQEDFILETLQGAINQDYENLEIIVSDDNSPDKTFEIIQSFFREYKGRHKIILNHNDVNLGIGGHVTKVLTELCHGEYIVIHGGDDISLPNRVTYSVDRMIATGVSSMCFNMVKIDDKSNEIGLMKCDDKSIECFYHVKDYLSDNFSKTTGATRIINKQLVDIFGGINNDCPTEDTVFNLRAIMTNGLGYNGHVMLKYRIHNNNVSNFRNLMLNVNPKYIYNQYSKDLEVAKIKHLVNANQYFSLKKHIQGYLSYNISIRFLYSKKNYVIRLLSVFLLPFISYRSCNKLVYYVKLVRKWHKEAITN